MKNYDTTTGTTGYSLADIAMRLNALSQQQQLRQQSQQSPRFTAAATAPMSTSAAAATTTRGGSLMDRKSAESTLQEFSAFCVTDNWLDDDLIALLQNNDNKNEEDEYTDFSDNAKPLDQQLEEWEQEDDDGTAGTGSSSSSSSRSSGSSPWMMEGDEPWDHWGEKTDDNQDRDDDTMKIEPNQGKSCFFVCLNTLLVNFAFILLRVLFYRFLIEANSTSSTIFFPGWHLSFYNIKKKLLAGISTKHIRFGIPVE